MREKYRLYVHDPEYYSDMIQQDYHYDTPSVEIVENSVLVPVMKPGDEKIAGVYDSSVSYMHDINETVIYGGCPGGGFGHMLTWYFSRLWWLLENPDTNKKIAFVNKPPEQFQFDTFLNLLGVKDENILFIQEPTRFKRIIVPEPATRLHDGFHQKIKAVYNKIRDSVLPAPYEKVYLTRTKFNSSGNVGDIAGEEYFEEYYTALGYEVISMDLLSVEKQIAVMAGAREIACAGGTLPHWILFCHDRVHVTILNRTPDNNMFHAQCWINQLRDAQCILVDPSQNFLKTLRFASCYLFSPVTEQWKRYSTEVNNIQVDINEIPQKYAWDYVCKWVNMVVQIDEDNFHEELTSQTMCDFVINFYKYILNNDLDEPAKDKIKARFSAVTDLNGCGG